MKNILIKFFYYFTLTLSALSVQQVIAATQSDKIEGLIAQGELQKALLLTDKELVKNSDDVNYRFLKGLILTKQNELDKAIDVFVKLTDEHPELPEPFNNLAVIYAAKGDFVKAREALQTAINTHPTYATAHENLGDIYAKMASKAYNQALQFDDDNATAREKLSLVSELFSTKSTEEVPNSGNKLVYTGDANAELERLDKELKEAREQTRRQRSEAENIRAELNRLEKDARSSVSRLRQEQNKTTEQARLEREKVKKIRSELADLELQRQDVIKQVKEEEGKVVQVREELRILEQKRVVAAEQVRLAQQQAQVVVDTRSIPQSSGENTTIGISAGRQDVIKTVMDWAKFWSNQDVKGYLSYYSDDFNPANGIPRGQWLVQRRVRLTKPGFIKVDINDPQVIFNGNERAQVSFIQAYQSDSFSDEANKTLILENRSGRWLIVEEILN